MREQDTIDVRMVDIAAGAGVNHAMVKYHFGSKEGLLFALIERDMEDALVDLDKLLTLDAKPTAKMRIHLRGILDTYYRIPYLNRLIQTMMRESKPERQRHIAKELLTRIAGAQAQIIGDGVAAGEFRDVDPKLFYFMTIGASDGLYSNRFTMSAVFGGLPKADDELHCRNREQTVELIMRGLVR